MSRNRPLRARPDGPIELNRDSPLAQGLALWVPLNGEYRLRGIAGCVDVAPTNTGVTATPVGEGGAGALFDANADKLDYGAIADGLDGSARATFATWVYFRTIDNSGSGRAIVSRWGSAAGTRRWLLAHKDGDGANLTVAVCDGTNLVAYNSTGAPLVANTRTLLVTTYDGASSPKMRIYVGGLEAGRSLLADQGVTALGTNVPAFTVGASLQGNSSTLADVHDVMVWRRVLSPAEIWQLWDPATRWDLYWRKSVRVAVPAGASGISGTLAVTLGALTATATGTLPIQGGVTSTLGALTATATGVVAITGGVTATLGVLTATATGQVAISGAATVTLGALTVAGTGTVGTGISGALSVTLGALTATAAGTVAVAGAASMALGAATTTAAGTVAITGAASQTLGAVSVAAAGTVADAGTTPTTTRIAASTCWPAVSDVGTAWPAQMQASTAWTED